MKRREYRTFSRKIHALGSRERVPLVGQYEITNRCNYRCAYCYLIGTERKNKRELNTEEAIVIIDKIKKAGCLWLCFTGGEPFTRRDFFEIYEYACKKGFIITIFTNGSLIDDEAIRKLKENPPFSIEMTLNGVTRKTLESISGTRGSHESCIQAIELMLKNGLPLKIKTQALTLNFDELPKIKSYVESKGLRFRLSANVYPKISGDTSPLQYRLTVDEVLRLSTLFKEEDFEQEDIEVREKVPGSDRIFRCAAGIWSFNINAYGEVFFCNFVREPLTNLLKEDFNKGFIEGFDRIRARTFKKDTECRRCTIAHMCHWCTSWARLEVGDPEKPIPYFCELAHRKLDMLKRQCT